MEDRGHSVGVELSIRGYIEGNDSLSWPAVTEQVQKSMADSRESTERGATGIAVLLVRQNLGLVVIERATIGEGIDYWLGQESDDRDSQRIARLEVSGTRRGDAARIRKLVRDKLAQTAPTDETLLPAYVVVVGFRQPVAEVRRK